MGAIISILVLLIELGLLVLVLAGLWKTFEKMGRPGWEGIIPIYNAIIIIQILRKPIWWIVLLLIPCVGIVVWVMLMIEFAKLFGKDTGFGIGLGLLGVIFFPILGFGDAKYQGPMLPPGGGFPTAPPQ